MIGVELNRHLDEFYDKHAVKEIAEEWLDNHPYQQAIIVDDDAIWMAR
jgi:hypothetical protein